MLVSSPRNRSRRRIDHRHRRAQATARKRRYRANLAAGQVVARVVVSNPVIAAFARHQWLAEPGERTARKLKNGLP